MGLPAARVNARSGRVCIFVCANVHAPFLGKAPYELLYRWHKFGVLLRIS